MFLVRESCDVQCDGVAGAIAAREKALEADRAADDDGAQASRHVAESDRVQLALDLALSAGFQLLRAMHERAFERRNSDRRVAKVCTLCKGRGKHKPIIVGVRQARRGVVQAPAAGAAAAGVAAAGVAGAGASAAGRSASRPVSDRDFSSFIIGDGVATASFFTTIR